MSTKQIHLRSYANQPTEKRIRYLMQHYNDYELYEAAYRKEIEFRVAETRAIERNRRDDLGVRIMSGTSLSDITFEQACESSTIKDSLKENGRPDKLVRDRYEKELIFQLVNDWRTFKRDYDALNSQLPKLGHGNYEMFVDILRQEKNYQQIADELMIELDSVKKKIRRFKAKIIQLIMTEYQETGLFRDLRSLG